MTYQNTARCFEALGDPTRREIVERLAARPRSVGDLASELPVSRPAVSQHLKTLKEAGLVSDEAAGTRRIYRLDPRGIGAMREVLESYWNRALGNFKAFADALEDEAEGKDQP
jgi:DNA-binding transcriptional ArsR family regulator